MVDVTLRYLRVSPKKAQMVVDMIRGQRVGDAVNMLQFSPRKSSFHMLKLLKSGLAAAEQRGDVDTETLVVKEAFVNEGPRIKRFRASARGKGSRIIRKTSHVTLRLSDQ